MAIKSRIQLKHDTEANWIKATNFIPLAGEIIIYDKDDNHDQVRIKVGDGIMQADGTVTGTKVNELSFINNNSSDSNIFIAEYGVTTFETIFNSVQVDGKVALCHMSDGSTLPLAYAHIDEIKFIGHTSDGKQEAICSMDNVWSTNDIDIFAPVAAPSRYNVTLVANELFYYANPDTDTLTIGGTFSSLPNGWFGFLTVYAVMPSGVSSSILETTSENGFTLMDIGDMDNFSMAIFKNGASSKLKWYLFKPLPSAEEASF